MKLALPSYYRTDYKILGIMLPACIVALNAAIFGSRYFMEALVFLTATVITGADFIAFVLLLTSLIISTKKRFPVSQQSNRQLVIAMLIATPLNVLLIGLLFYSYASIQPLHYSFNRKEFVVCCLGFGLLTMFFILVMEGVLRYNDWRKNLTEIGQLKKNFIQSQALDLKSQVNPHFLFNSLNTLSSLISEDEQAAEEFLNEMSKVYRYLLQGNEEPLVTLLTEIKFITSYIHVLQKRFGKSLQISLNILPADTLKLLPPLSLQVLIENAFTLNSMSKTEPLTISICSDEHYLRVTNNRKPKAISPAIDFESGLDNLVTRYRLLHAGEVMITEEAQQRSIALPLVENKGGLA